MKTALHQFISIGMIGLAMVFLGIGLASNDPQPGASNPAFVWYALGLVTVIVRFVLVHSRLGRGDADRGGVDRA